MIDCQKCQYDRICHVPSKNMTSCQTYKPFTDAVEVVRCRNCIRKAEWLTNKYGAIYCGYSGMYIVDEDIDYCSYGVRGNNG